MATLRGPQHETTDAIRATPAPVRPGTGMTLELTLLRVGLYVLAALNFFISLNPGQANMVTGFLGMTLALAALALTAKRA